jgi:hypothetical protein
LLFPTWAEKRRPHWNIWSWPGAAAGLSVAAGLVAIAHPWLVKIQVAEHPLNLFFPSLAQRFTR